jgi:hypothetical protein
MAESGSGFPRKTPSNKTPEKRTGSVALHVTRREWGSLAAAHGAIAREKIRKNKNFSGMI